MIIYDVDLWQHIARVWLLTSIMNVILKSDYKTTQLNNDCTKIVLLALVCVTGLTLSGPWLGVWAAHSRCDWFSIGSLKTNVSDFFEIKKYWIKVYLKMPYWNGRHLFLSQTLRWRHNERDSVSSHQPHDCLLNGLFRRRSKKTSKLRVTGLCVVNSPHKGPVTRKMFPFDDVIMKS